MHNQISRSRQLAAALALLALTFAPMALGEAKKPKKPQAPVAPKQLVWPQPPQAPRIRYIGQLSGEDELKGQKKRSWMDRLAGVKQLDNSKRLTKPYGVAADSRHRIFVADAANRSVFVFDPDHKSIEFRGASGPGRLALPIGVAIDGKDRLFVSDSFQHQITCFDPDGGVLGVFGATELKRPSGLAIDDQRHRLFVADAKANLIALFDTDSFQFLGYWGTPSPRGEKPPGTFAAPTNLAVDAQGNLYVTDTWNYRIQAFDPDGKFLREFGQQGAAPGSFVRPKGIAVDSDGHIYVADSEFNNFQIFTPEGIPLMAVGNYGVEPGQFILVTGMAITKDNRIYVTEQFRPRVQIFEYIPEDAKKSPEIPNPPVKGEPTPQN